MPNLKPKLKRRGGAIVVVVAAIVTLCVIPSLGHQQKKSNARGIQSPDKETRLSAQSRARVRQAIAAVGLLLVRNGGDDPEPRPRGSGVVVRNDGLVVTNYHVITIAKSNRLYDEIYFSPSSDAQSPSASNFYRLKPLLSDKENDLALLRIESDREGRSLPQLTTFPTIEIGDSRAIELLEDLIVVGFPEKGGTTVTLSTGVVEGKDTIRNWIKTDARLIHGNSGGAAVDSNGKLIGIPTKVEADVQSIDRNGDGSPDSYRRYGAVGFLRPAYLITTMIAELDNPNARQNANQQPDPPFAKAPSPSASVMKPPAPKRPSPGDVFVSGLVRSQPNSKPIAGAIVGIVPIGTMKVTEENLLAWGNSNLNGIFKLNNPIPPGKYVLRATAIGRTPYSREIEITQNMAQLVIEMRPSTSN
jgi:S1-C subfamily serine protease